MNILSQLNYAELAPIQTSYCKNKQFIPTRKKEDGVIYAEIEHEGKQLRSAMIEGPESVPYSSGRPRNHHREVVTTKGPLMGYHQESCV